MNEQQINKLIGEKIKTLRKQSKLNQTQLAEELSIHYKHLGCIENGKKAISISLLSKLCRVFDKEPFYFFDFSIQELNNDDNKLINSAINMLKLLDSNTRVLLIHMIKSAYELKNNQN